MLLCFGGTGCTVWSSVPPTALAQPSGDQAEVWAGDTVVLADSLRVYQDSLVGVVKLPQQGAAWQAVSWSSEEVDSVRVKKVSPTRTVLAGVGGGAFALVFFVGLSGGLCQGGCD